MKKQLLIEFVTEMPLLTLGAWVLLELLHRLGHGADVQIAAMVIYLVGWTAWDLAFRPRRRKDRS